MLLKNCKYIVTPTVDGDIRVFRDASILIDGGVIVQVGDVNVGDGDVIHCDGIAIPGLFNAHTHLAMTIFRGLVDGLELQDWLRVIWGIERRLRLDTMLKGFELGLIESLINGTTALVDMYFLDDVIPLVEKYGVRVFEGPTFMDNFEDPKLTEARLRNLIAATKGSRLVKPILNLHSVYANNSDTLLRVADLKRELGLRLHTHVSETRWEVYDVKRRFNLYPVDVLAKYNLLDQYTILVHLGWVTSWEISRITEAKANVVHCPTSNMKLATAGFFPVREFMGKVNVALGTDGPGSGDSLDLFREMKMAVLLQRNNYWDASALTAGDAVTMATYNGYRAVGLRGGIIGPGYLADLIILDHKDPRVNPMGEFNLVNNIVYAFTGSMVKATIVDGKVVYGDHNRRKLVERAHELSDELKAAIEDLLPPGQRANA